MSNALAIAATTATLRNLLQKRVPPLAGVSGLELTTQPPDEAGRSDKEAQLNLFLYQTVINGAWRNLDMPRQVRPGETGSPPLSLNLHYLITAYGRGGADKDISDRILGGAMSVLHDHPVLGRKEIKDALKDSGLDEQFERLRITPMPMGLEEMSKLWMVFQTQYRITAAYEVTVVLIDSRSPVKAPLPVLKRGEKDRGATVVTGAAPGLDEIRPPGSQLAMRLGEDVTIRGSALTVNDTKVRFTSLRLKDPIELAPRAGPSQGEISVHIPDEADDAQAFSRWVPGFYAVGLVRQRAGSPIITSNELAFGLAPRITVAPNAASTGDEITLTCKPRIAVDQQRVLVLFGDRQLAPTDVTNPADLKQPTKVTFDVPDVTAGDYVVRLRVDGVDSIPVEHAGTPPVPSFDPAQKVTVA
jgi:Pvc16 N-terminal domain